MNEFFTNAVKSFKKNPITTLGIVIIAMVLMFVALQVYNHIPTSIKENKEEIKNVRVEMNQNYRELNEKIDKLNEKIDSNQHEIKDLIIKHLIEKK